MTLGGWIIMISSVGSVSILFVWCVFKVLTTPEDDEKLHGFEIETPDVEKD